MENTIRFAAVRDIPLIMEFIEQYWKKGHILGSDREIFEYTYCYKGEVGFVICESDTGSIEGVLGFTPYSPKDGGSRDLATAIWKMNSQKGFMHGMLLVDFLMKNGSCEGLYCIGLAEKAIPIIKFLGLDIAACDNYYLLNPDFDDYKIASFPGMQKPDTKAAHITDKEAMKACHDLIMPYKKPNNCGSKDPIQKSLGLDGNILISRIFDADKLRPLMGRSKGHKPHKSADYIQRRFFEYPVWDYQGYLIEKKDKDIWGLLIGRYQKAEGRTVYRIIDIIGDVDVMEYAADLLNAILRNPELPCEYIDCVVCGMPEGIMEKAGFKKVNDEEVIIPDHFSPFERKNSHMYCYKPKGVDAILFKGDGDQDRPNSRQTD